MQQATTTENWKHAISFQFLLLPTLNLGMTYKYSQQPRTDSSLVQAQDWQIPREPPHRALPGHPHPATPAPGFAARAEKVVSHWVQAQTRVSAGHEPSRLSWSWTTEVNSSSATGFSENRIRSVTRMSKRQVRHYELVSLGRLRTFVSSPSRRKKSFIFV